MLRPSGRAPLASEGGGHDPPPEEEERERERWGSGVKAEEPVELSIERSVSGLRELTEGLYGAEPRPRAPKITCGCICESLAEEQGLRCRSLRALKLFTALFTAS